MVTMNPAKTIAVAVCLGMFSATAGAQQPGALHGLIAQHEQALADARASHNIRSEGTELNTLANLYREAGDPQKGLDYCAQALSIETSKGQQAQSKNVEGRILTDLGQEQKALDLFTEIMPIWQQINSVVGEASTLNNMGRVYNDLGQRDKALAGSQSGAAHVAPKQQSCRRGQHPRQSRPLLFRHGPQPGGARQSEPGSPAVARRRRDGRRSADPQQPRQNLHQSRRERKSA